MFGVMNKAYVCSTSAHAQPRTTLFCFSLVKSQQTTEELKIDITIKNKEEGEEEEEDEEEEEVLLHKYY